MAKNKTQRKSAKVVAPIVIDKEAGLVFKSKKELYDFFQDKIEVLENDFMSNRKDDDFSDEEIYSLENYLELTLDEPDEVWRDNKTFEGQPTVFYYLRKFEEDSPRTYYIAACYIDADESPTFIFTHFATQDPDLVQHFRRGDFAYDKNYEAVGPGALEGDGLSEGDPLAMGLYLSMLKLRSDKDIAPEKFNEFAPMREETIESADEIWRNNDIDGNVLVTFIKEYPDHETTNLKYLAITQEDEDSGVHALLYSFPTNDENLVDRYRRGENLQAEEVVQESSH